MPNVLARLRHWWTRPEQQPSGAAPYAIPCACGKMVTGQRKKDYQIVPCPQCKGELFVLPLSPLPRLASPSGEFSTPQAFSPKRTPFLPWRLLALAVGCACLLLLGIYLLIAFFFPHLPFSLESNPETARNNVQEAAKAHVIKADQYIGLGHFSLALEQLDALAALQLHHSELWEKAGGLDYQRKEIALYVDLLGDSLENLLEQAIDLPEQEFQQLFTKRYLHKAVILDTEVIRLAEDRITHSYTLQVGGQQGKLNLQNLAFFANLPTGKPQRVLFGARLASIHRQKPGMWIIEFNPESLTLLTNPAALAISCPALSNETTRKLLAKQQDLVNK